LPRFRQLAWRIEGEEREAQTNWQSFAGRKERSMIRNLRLQEL